MKSTLLLVFAVQRAPSKEEERGMPPIINQLRKQFYLLLFARFSMK